MDPGGMMVKVSERDEEVGPGVEKGRGREVTMGAASLRQVGGGQVKDPGGGIAFSAETAFP